MYISYQNIKKFPTENQSQSARVVHSKFKTRRDNKTTPKLIIFHIRGKNIFKIKKRSEERSKAPSCGAVNEFRDLPSVCNNFMRVLKIQLLESKEGNFLMIDSPYKNVDNHVRTYKKA